MTKNGLPLSALLLAATFAHAENYLSPTNERVRLTLGVMQQSSSSSLKLDSSQGIAGAPINAEKDFGLDKSNLEPKFQAMVRTGERHRVRFDYFTLDRSGSAPIAAPLVFRDVLLVPGDAVKSNLSLRTFSITYGYSFIHRERFELAATLGINETEISSRARVTTQFRHVDQREDQAGPLPTVGLDATFVLSKRFYVDARGQYLRANVQQVSGTLSFYEIDALYRLRPNVAFGFGYTTVKAHSLSRQKKNGGYINFDSKGPQAFVRVSF